MTSLRSLPSMLAATLSLALAGCIAGEAAESTLVEDPAPQMAQEGGAMILVELFTSQGCSSCPPADRVLSELGDVHGIVPLAFHVDYWNSLGWPDPFSSSQWSTRQREYATVLPGGRVYTPQAVIQGRQHCVGSRRSCVEDAAGTARDLPQTASLEGVVKDSKNGTLEVALEMMASTAEPLEAYVVLVENALVTEVPRGENARRTLRNDHVVRRLARAASLEGPTKEGLAAATTVSLDLDPAWNRQNLGVVAFLQNPRTREIQAVTRIEAPRP